MPRPCEKRHTLNPTTCPVCWRAANDGFFQAKWGLPVTAPTGVRRPGGKSHRVVASPPKAQPSRLSFSRLNLPCIHEGKVFIPCTTCGAEGRHIRHCHHPEDKYEYCARSHPGPRTDIQVQICQHCPDYDNGKRMSPPFRRNLLYHIYPIGGNGIWQWNVDQMTRRLGLFDGKIVVAIVLDPPSGRKSDPLGPHRPDQNRHFAPCDSAEVVMSRFGQWRHKIEFITLENDPHLREVVSFEPLMSRVKDHAPNEVTLYAQAKGTTRRANHVARHWTQRMYEVYLDYWHIVEEQLTELPVTGAFKKHGAGWRPELTSSDWHYSGSWFWFRNRDLFATDWQRIDQFWSGIEPYPSQHFDARTAGSLFMEDKVQNSNYYRWDYWVRVVDPALKVWKAEADAKRPK